MSNEHEDDAGGEGQPPGTPAPGEGEAAAGGEEQPAAGPAPEEGEGGTGGEGQPVVAPVQGEGQGDAVAQATIDQTEPIDIVFYTVGDTRPLEITGGGESPQTSELYRQAGELRASPGHVYGVASIQEAREILEGLTAGSVRRISFIGHGYRMQEPAAAEGSEGGADAGGEMHSGFFFGGHTDPDVSWNHDADDEILYAPDPADDVDHNTPFLDQMSRVLRQDDDSEVEFMACHTGEGDLPEAIARHLESTHRGEVHSTDRLHGISWSSSDGVTGYHTRAFDEHGAPTGGQLSPSSGTDDTGHLNRRVVYGAPAVDADGPGDDDLFGDGDDDVFGAQPAPGGGGESTGEAAPAD